VPGRILLVEDDHAILESLAELLEEEGYRVTSARNGAQALALLRAAALPDAILLDLMMPGMDGYEFRRHQLADRTFAEIPTLVLTAGAVDARLRALKVQGWLKKPINLEALFAALARHCGGAKALIRTDHAVFFYEAESHLGLQVAHYISDGLEQGEVVLGVATAPHLADIRRELAVRGVDVLQAEQAGLLELFDATTTLAGLLVEGSLSPARVRAVGTKLVTAATARAPAGRLRIFGEMVSLLWEQGDVSGAVELEHVWSSLAAEYHFSLLCSYPAAAGHGPHADDLCNAHTTVAWPG
jgi:CheY-like chemotaxis protein